MLCVKRNYRACPPIEDSSKGQEIKAAKLAYPGSFTSNRKFCGSPYGTITLEKNPDFECAWDGRCRCLSCPLPPETASPFWANYKRTGRGDLRHGKRSSQPGRDLTRIPLTPSPLTRFRVHTTFSIPRCDSASRRDVLIRRHLFCASNLFTCRLPLGGHRCGSVLLSRNYRQTAPIDPVNDPPAAGFTEVFRGSTPC